MCSEYAVLINCPCCGARVSAVVEGDLDSRDPADLADVYIDPSDPSSCRCSEYAGINQDRFMSDVFSAVEKARER